MIYFKQTNILNFKGVDFGTLEDNNKLLFFIFTCQNATATICRILDMIKSTVTMAPSLLTGSI